MKLKEFIKLIDTNSWDMNVYLKDERVAIIKGGVMYDSNIKGHILNSVLFDFYCSLDVEYIKDADITITKDLEIPMGWRETSKGADFVEDGFHQYIKNQDEVGLYYQLVALGYVDDEDRYRIIHSERFI